MPPFLIAFALHPPPRIQGNKTDSTIMSPAVAAASTSTWSIIVPPKLKNLSCSFGNRRISALSSSSGGGSGNDDGPHPTLVPVVVPQQPGGKMVAELVGAFHDLTHRMSPFPSNTSSTILFNTLKLSIPLLPSTASTSRSPLSRALSIAFVLADLKMDAEVISAGILKVGLETGALSMLDVKTHIGITTAHLLHENLRFSNIPLATTLESWDDGVANSIRKFCLTYYDIRAMVLELAHKLDAMKHLHHLPRYNQQRASLEVLRIYAPLAHAIGVGTLSLELEDLSFRYLFPNSYLYIDSWLKTHETSSKPSLTIHKDQLSEALEADPELQQLVDVITIKGRYKSRFSTMKKVLKDGRRPEDVNDLLGLRVILNPSPGNNGAERGLRACHRVHEVIRSLWKEVPTRTKDYISKPKKNGYRSLHVAVDLSDRDNSRPLMEIQIRTTEMDSMAGGGTASHSLYKGGLTDPVEAKRLKAIMLAAAQFAALRLSDIPTAIKTDDRDPVFRLLDKNGDGRISIDELAEVIEELGAEREDALELMQLLDVNSDGSLSSDEFDSFKREVQFMWNMKNKDGQYRALLGEKLEVADPTGLIQVYRKELGDRLAVKDS